MKFSEDVGFKCACPAAAVLRVDGDCGILQDCLYFSYLVLKAPNRFSSLPTWPAGMETMG